MSPSAFHTYVHAKHADLRWLGFEVKWTTESANASIDNIYDVNHTEMMTPTLSQYQELQDGVRMDLLLLSISEPTRQAFVFQLMTEVKVSTLHGRYAHGNLSRQSHML